MEVFLKLGANPNVKDSEGITPLMKAVESGNTKVVKLLLELGANIDAQDNHGNTALMFAMPKQEIRIPKHLRKYAINYQSAQRLRLKDVFSTIIATILLEASADFTIQNNNGQTALDIAKENQRPDIVKLLKKHNKHGCYLS